MPLYVAALNVVKDNKVPAKVYLNHGKLTSRREVASVYSSPSAAKRAIGSMLAKMAKVIDTNVYLPIIERY